MLLKTYRCSGWLINCSGTLTLEHLLTAPEHFRNWSGTLISAREDLKVYRKTYNCYGRLISASEVLWLLRKAYKCSGRLSNCSGALTNCSGTLTKTLLIHAPISALVYVNYACNRCPSIARTIFRMPHVSGLHLVVIFYQQRLTEITIWISNDILTVWCAM